MVGRGVSRSTYSLGPNCCLSFCPGVEVLKRFFLHGLSPDSGVAVAYETRSNIHSAIMQRF